MEAATQQNTLLAELETLQDDLIARLDALDQRVCGVLQEWTGQRGADDGSAGAGDLVNPADAAGCWPCEQSLAADN